MPLLGNYYLLQRREESTDGGITYQTTDLVCIVLCSKYSTSAVKFTTHFRLKVNFDYNNSYSIATEY